MSGDSNGVCVARVHFAVALGKREQAEHFLKSSLPDRPAAITAGAIVLEKIDQVDAEISLLW